MIDEQPSDDSISILHVDDEPDFADLVATFIEQEDARFTVETATNASEGLEHLANEDFDCVVSDYEMPGQNGIEFLETVREDNPDLPFILFTGKGSEEIASEAITAGVTDYLQKETGTDQYTVLANRIENAVEKRRAEQEAEQARRRIQAITENSTDAIITIDTESEIRFANPAVKDLFGYAPGDLLGESLTTLMPSRYRDDYQEAFTRYLETGEPTLNWSDIEFSARHRDGHDIPVSLSYGEFEEDDDQRFVGIIRDISEREKSHRRLETLIDNLPGMVYRCQNEQGWPMENVRGEVEALTGYPPSEIERRGGIYGTEIIHPDDRAEVWGAVQDALEDKQSFELTYRIHTNDGITKWVWERGRGIYSDNGELEALEGFITDVTERETARQ